MQAKVELETNGSELEVPFVDSDSILCLPFRKFTVPNVEEHCEGANTQLYHNN